MSGSHPSEGTAQRRRISVRARVLARGRFDDKSVERVVQEGDMELVSLTGG